MNWANKCKNYFSLVFYVLASVLCCSKWGGNGRPGWRGQFRRVLDSGAQGGQSSNWWTFCIWSVFVCMSRMIDKFGSYQRFTSTTQQRWQKRSQPWWNCRTGSFVGLWLAWGLRFSWGYNFVEIWIFFREKKKLQDELNQLSRNCLTDVQSRFWFSIKITKCSRPLPIQGILAKETPSPLVPSRLTCSHRRNTPSLTPSTLLPCN